MFNPIKLEDLLSNTVYSDCTIDISVIDEESGGIYTGYLESIEMYVNSNLFKQRYSENTHQYLSRFWFYNPAHHVHDWLTSSTCTMPISWLVWSKSMLKWDYLPSDFQPWALAVLEWFDLERYHQAYHLPQEEYEAIKHDLPLVIEGLKNYPVEKLAPPVGENENM